MTLVVAVTGPESIWLLADRRLSFAGRPPKDDGCKVMLLDTTDGVAILGYAGLGATGRRTEPSDWMSAVLRGRNLPLEKSLGVLSRALREQLPRHMIRMPDDSIAAHHVIVPAFLGTEPRLYSIDLVLAPDRKSGQFRYTRYVSSASRTPRLGIGGSGARSIMQDKKWMRSLLRIVRANDQGKVSPHAVADHLAALNYDVHQAVPAVPHKLVGPRCIVTWRFRKGGVHNGGGGHQFYTGTERDASSPTLPVIIEGNDWKALLEVTMPHVKEQMKAMLAGEPAKKQSKDEINADLARLPVEPDEKLR